MLLAILPSITAVPANLLLVPTTREPPHSNSGPPEFSHQFRQAATSASTAAVLRGFQNIEHSLCGDTLDTVITNFTVQPF
jgi:hypothetical protein